eukprot:COSAG05_NODE_1_length_66591_cov_307.301581_14_plen_173_part_00
MMTVFLPTCLSAACICPVRSCLFGVAMALQQFSCLAIASLAGTLAYAAMVMYVQTLNAISLETVRCAYVPHRSCATPPYSLHILLLLLLLLLLLTLTLTLTLRPTRTRGVESQVYQVSFAAMLVRTALLCWILMWVVPRKLRQMRSAESLLPPAYQAGGISRASTSYALMLS